MHMHSVLVLVFFKKEYIHTRGNARVYIYNQYSCKSGTLNVFSHLNLIRILWGGFYNPFMF